MKKRILAVTLAGGLFLTACTAGNAGNVGSEELVLSSDQGSITTADFYEALRNHTSANEVLEQLVHLQVFGEQFEVTDEEVEAMIDGYKEEFGETFEEDLPSMGFPTMDHLREEVRENLLLRRGVYESIPEERFVAEAAKLQVQASHILVDDEALANEIRAELDNGADFVELVAEHSRDQSTSPNGGDLGVFVEGMMVPEFWKAASQLSVGEISPVVATDFGFHIIKATDVIEGRELEELSEEEVQALGERIVNDMFQDGSAYNVIEGIIGRANLEIHDDLFEDFLTAGHHDHYEGEGEGHDHQ